VPSYERTRRFDRDWKALAEVDRARFRFGVQPIRRRSCSWTFRRGLRVKRIQGTDSVFEMTWGPDGRATFEYGTPAGEGAHVIWPASAATTSSADPERDDG
jgi:hypothetical protein